MRKYFLPASAAILFSALVGVGCNSFTKKAAPNSFPVQIGSSTTNDTQAVAWLQASRAINLATPLSPAHFALDQLLGAGIALASAVSGWAARHSVQRREDKKPPTS